MRLAWLLSAANGVWFVIVYGGCDWFTAHRNLRVPIHLPIEMSIPLVPGAVLVYMSIYALFLAGPFIIRERREFTALILALALATVVAGIGFLLVPARAAFAPPGELGIWAGLFRFADQLNLDYNMVPSLHVTFSVACVKGFARHASRVGRILLWTWAAAIALSTVLTHQHHLVDVVTGWVLGLCSYRAGIAFLNGLRSNFNFAAAHSPR
ncbi:MAG TPA: phosphatase PAP2 family protein [Verrucomicrobiae bacterium]|nr:phosphatase PAP2 family protein [Verrucomicrobiae bacterium]